MRIETHTSNKPAHIIVQRLPASAKPHTAQGPIGPWCATTLLPQQQHTPTPTWAASKVLLYVTNSRHVPHATPLKDLCSQSGC